MLSTIQQIGETEIDVSRNNRAQYTKVAHLDWPAILQQAASRGQSTADVAAELGCAKQTVTSYVRKCNARKWFYDQTTLNRIRRYDIDWRNVLASAVSRRITVSELMRELGLLSRQGIYNKMAEHNIWLPTAEDMRRDAKICFGKSFSRASAG
jgi:predicted transcriptional regulator